MRNLKKILALVLALVMTFSVMATANAFTDDASINADYEEAIAVLSGMGVFKGYEDGSFQPKGTITRAEVAAIIYRVATGDVKDKQVSIYADYNVFSDVPASAWYAGYVNYCANAEYILGYGNGKFGPNDNVTGYQALAMILRAVGYDKMGEFTGATWQVQTAAVGKKLDITDNITDTTLGVAATREVIAEILFQTIVKAVQVDYTLAFGYSTRNNETLGVANFGLANTESTDDWGRPCTVWYGETKKAAGYDSKDTVYAVLEETPVATYTVAATECEIAKDLGVKKTATVTVYDNGVAGDYALNALDTKTTLGGQGTLLEVYDNDHIVVIDTYLAQVGRYITEKLDAKGHVIRDDSTKINVWFAADATEMSIDGAVDYAEDDYVLVYYNEAEKYVEIVDAADSIVGAQTKYTTKASHIVENEEYADAAQFNHDEAVNKTTKYTWFFDQYGNLIGSFEIASIYTYGTISSIYWKDSNDGENGFAQATITYIDGTSEAAVIAKINGTTLKSGDSEADYDLGLVSETKQYNKDVFTNVALYKISESSSGLVLVDTTYLPDATTETGVPALTDEIDAGNATEFLVWTGSKYETYTGIKNIPTYTDGDFWYVDLNGNKVVEYVFIIEPVDADATKTYTYYFNDDLTVTTNLKSNAIVSYTITGGLVNGEPAEITTKSADLKNDILASASTLLVLTEVNGYVTEAAVVTDKAVKVSSLSAYVVYAGAAYDAVLDTAHDVLIDEFGYSYDVEAIEQIIDDEDLADAIDKADNNDEPEYLYIVYKYGAKDTKIASLIYVASVEGTLYVETPVAPVVDPLDEAMAKAGEILKGTNAADMDAMAAELAAMIAEPAGIDAADYVKANELIAALTAKADEIEAAAAAAAALKAAKDDAKAALDTYAADVVANGGWGSAADVTAADLAATVAAEAAKIDAAADEAAVAAALTAAKQAVWDKALDVQAGVANTINVTTTAELNDALATYAEGNVIVLAEGTYQITANKNLTKDVTIRGTGVVEIYSNATINAQSDVVLENLTFITAAGKRAAETTGNCGLEVKDCVFTGDGYGLYNNPNATLKVTGCTFDALDVAIGSECAYAKMTITGNDFTGCVEALGLTTSALAAGETQTAIDADMVANNTGVTADMVNLY